MSRLMFDISEHDGSNLDFPAIAEQGIGLIIRAGFGSGQKSRQDYEFQDNVAKAEYFGIDYGLYWYSYASTREDAEKEANNLIVSADMVASSHLVYPLFLDVEESSLANVSRETCAAFGEYMNGSGYRYGIYASYYWWLNNCPNMLEDPDCVRWVAYWNQDPPLIDWWDIWQFGAYDWQGRSIDGNWSDYPLSGIQSLESLALDVLKGKYGILRERIEKLGDRYAETQSYINDCYVKANDVIRGKYGNGDERKRLLGKDYPCVQYIVDSFLCGDYS